MSSRVLIVDDEQAARYGIRRGLEKEGFQLFEADSIGSARGVVNRENPQIVILDVKLATESGLDYLPELVALPNPPIVIIATAHGSERLAVEAIKNGAYNYLAKPFELDDLRIIVHNAAETYRLREENTTLKNHLSGSSSYGQLLGTSSSMRKVYSLIEKVAGTSASVLITGESGTGKEIVAREIHTRSPDRDGPFVALNCAAMPENLIESELFGHEKGAFTGANSRRVGKFEAANKGTLFLDEIGDMSLVTQAKILRVLEERKYQRLGSNVDQTADVRIISATNKNLEREVEQQLFRADLYYRLCVVAIHLPPLRERKEDIPALAESFCSRYSLLYKKNIQGLSPNLMKALLQYDWPGNIRQMKNIIERAVILTEPQEGSLKEIPEEIDNKVPTENIFEANSLVNHDLLALDFQEAKKAFEKLYIERCLNQTSGNITQAAALLGMHRQSLQHKIKELGLTKKFVSTD
jgi:DNA-binding NtrC family response regulator